MDDGIYDRNENNDFINRHYFEPLVFDPVKKVVKEDFQSDDCFKLMDQHKKVIVNGVLFLLLVLLLILLFFSNHTKCLKKMKLKK